MDDTTWSSSNHVAAWPASEAGFDADSLPQMGKEWGDFISIFQSCLELVDKVPMEQCGWEERRADEKLVKAMEPWLSGQAGQAGQASMDANKAKGLPDDFLTLWTNHLQSKMFYKLLGTDVQPAITWAEIQKKKFWCSGRHGLLIIAVGLRWAWLKLQEPYRVGSLEAWIKITVELTELFEKVFDGFKTR